MPELPEFEIHARKLRDWMPGRRILRATILDEKLLGDPDPDAWQPILAGRTVTAVRREAKYLFLDLDPSPAGALHTLVAHLRMTGRFVQDTYVVGTPAHPTRFAMTLDDGTRVRFEDRRRFGRLWLSPTPDVAALPEVAHLGPDALRVPLSPEALGALCARSHRPIKVFLMDQRRIGGLGNICAIEILFRARIAPTIPAALLPAAAIARIARIIPEYLEWAIDRQSRRTLLYIGEKGSENIFPIYHREGTPCPNCATAIARIVQAGRSTYYCPACQSGS